VLAEELFVGYWKKVKMWKLASQWHFKLRANSSVTANNTRNNWTHCVNRPFCFKPYKESVIWKQRCWN
jgi:hypothetical protein